ncbi:MULTISPECIES: DUF5652 family protein [unclassified Rhodococcus (in: high G+C Gram-positive bacteria)]|uniref:DUF5652 family protein n=1 Tax=unclassified Rhodococcus (in: high G+C Gram-positive bacteria) TaxID=192944 RepID=UPI00207866CF|nr:MULTISPECIES: DUF5652 family protein [unclassified Rhodococcus (in: high G+C Gram-positive bacteria)]
MSDRERRWLLVASVVEGVLKIAALVDIKRRSADEIRGSKAAWATAVVLVNSVGVIPIVYFLRGRRPLRNAG